MRACNVICKGWNVAIGAKHRERAIPWENAFERGREREGEIKVELGVLAGTYEYYLLRIPRKNP